MRFIKNLFKKFFGPRTVDVFKWYHAKDVLPRDGQQVYYFGPNIGLWVGHYKYAPNDPYSHHLFVSNFGTVDRMDAPYWRPFNKKHHRLGFIPLPPAMFLSEDLFMNFMGEEIK